MLQIYTRRSLQPEVLTLEHLKCLNKVLKFLNQKF